MLLPLHGRKNILLHGLPGSGKTTLVERLVNKIPYPKRGFYTREVREKGRRIGFKIVTLEGKEAWLAKRGKGYPQVGKYKVYVELFEKLAVPTISEVKENEMIIIDEIGKMELFSKPFQEAVLKVLDSKAPVLATVGYGLIPFVEELFKREDAIFAEVTPESRDYLVDRIAVEFYRPGFLIAIEGLDGSGKSTFIKGLAQKLEEKGEKVCVTREPTSGEWGQKIREHLAAGSKISPQAMAELFLRDRREHAQNFLIPKLQDGQIILCDRYYLSTMAYQGACELDIKEIKKANETWAPVPDLILYLKVSVEEALKRVNQRKFYKPEVFETQEFLTKVASIYENNLKYFRHEIIDASASPEEVLERAWEALSKHLEAWKERFR
ncbi:thymidylate kinase [Thermodesulfatator indicus DSM 15286]|uniref:Thymidylate kinase n=1 Tax=Thermodesulfatator indicus (strain DSM 15286 / JCM 11887 / CIR29812) TaxID=667014 RepID=F8ADX6_THEID|nr:NTPase [Thermodesulfatator indicus]AEH44941.1 thymidylate kinase [Thermodesulfatator indicus DSM 15286]